ncbi:MAG TPA: TonB family protein [Rudaea sp.]
MTALLQSWVPWIDLLGWMLVHFLWQGLAIGIGYLALRSVFRSVTARYRVGMAALVAIAACPLLTAAWLWPQGGQSGAVEMSGAVEAVLAPIAAASPWHFRALLPWCVAAWFVGVIVIALRAFLHWRRLNWLVRFASASVPECREMLARLRERFGIRRPVRLLASLRVGTPMLIGWFKPAILLPTSMLTGFTPQQIELIVAHELAHVRRWDYLANLFQVVVETVLFYHPVVHWISRDVRNARESCCDDLVLTFASGSRVAYARALADLEELRHDMPVAPALGAGGGVLLARIRRIVGMPHEFHEPLPRNNSLLLVLIAAAGVLVGAMRLHGTSVPAPIATAPADALQLVATPPRIADAIAKTFAPAQTPAERARPAVDIKPTQTSNIDARRTETQPAVVELPALRPARPRIEAEVQLPLGAIKNVAIAPPSALDRPAADVVVDETSATSATTTPAIVRMVQPHYPPRAEVSGETATVVLEFGIDASGSVRNVHPVGKQSNTAFVEAASDALREWKFSTAHPIDTTQRYTKAFAFTRAGDDACHEVTGSHICRRNAEVN